MQTLSRSQQQQLDQLWTARTGLPLLLLMEQAATAVSQTCQKLIQTRWPNRPVSSVRILILAGTGQNGGDAFACARLLAAEHYEVTCVEVFPSAARPAEARQNREAWLALGHDCPDLTAERLTDDRHPDVVIDGIFGSGFKIGRPLPAPVVNWSRLAQKWQKSGTLVVAIDLPSGVDADSGQAAPDAFSADYTVTLIRPKIGLCAAPGRFLTGELIIDRIGVPDELVSQVLAGQPTVDLTDAVLIKRLEPERRPDSHKGSTGRVLILGGAPGMPGAVILAVQAASRSGAGLVYLGVSESIASQVLAAVAESILTVLPDDDLPRIRQQLETLAAGKSVVAIGPGAGLSHWLDQALDLAIASSPFLVIDADGLNALSRAPDAYQVKLFQRQAAGLSLPILTPHPGELARLAPDISQADRQAAARTLAARYQAIVLLKGAATVIAHPDGSCWINPTGNSGLAKGGSGDILTGLIAGLLAQGLSPINAAIAGAYLHGLAADLASDLQSGGTGIRSLMPGDVVSALGRAIAAAGWQT